MTPPSDAPPDLAPVVTARFGDIAVHALRSGWVRCKRAHRLYRGPDALRLPAIVLDRAWTEWMPVTVYAIAHPEGVFLVDAGQTERTHDARALDCDPGTRWFYAHQLRLAFTPEDRIDRRLAQAGLPLDAVRGVVLSHRHADHADGLACIPPRSTVYVGEHDWPGHQGALPRHWPADGRAPVLVPRDRGEPFGALAHSTPLTRDGRVRVVPLPGHSPGHLGVMVALEGGARFALFAGDATFALEHVTARAIAGICERPADARRTLDALAAQLTAAPTLLLPCHEAAALERLASA